MIRAGEDKIQFWTLLGPIFLLSTLCLTVFHSRIFNFDIWTITILGIAGLWKWKTKAFLAIVGAIMLSSIYKHASITSDHFWQLGVELSVLLGFCITALSFDQVAIYFQKFEENKEKFLQEIDGMKKDLCKEKDFHERQEQSLRKELEEHFWKLEEKKEQLKSVQSLLDTLRKNLDDQKENRDALLAEVQRLERKISLISNDKEELKEEVQTLQNDSGLQKQNQELLDEINQLRVENNQIALSLESRKSEQPASSDPDLENRYEKTRLHLKQLSKKHQKLLEEMQALKEQSNFFVSEEKFVQLSDEEKQKTLLEYKKKLKQLEQTEELYKQMKVQFEEKTQALKHVRSQLKRFQEERNSMYNEKQQRKDSISPREHKLCKKLEEAEKQVNHFQNENQKLQNIISNLS